jgi:hypothetical protein
MSALSYIAAALRKAKEQADSDRSPDHASRNYPHDHTDYEELPSGHLPGSSSLDGVLPEGPSKGGGPNVVDRSTVRREPSESDNASSSESPGARLRGHRGSRKFEDSPEIRAILYGSTSHLNQAR